MTDWDLQHYDVREMVNGTWLILNISLAIVFWRRVWLTKRAGGWKALREDPVAQAAIGLAVYFTGSGVMRAWVWMLLVVSNAGDDAAFIGEHYEIALAAAATAIVGALCCIRVFYPRRWLWIVTGVLAAAAPVTVHFWML